MTSRSAVTGALLVGAVLVGPSASRADGPKSERRGAVVIAVGEDAVSAARVLAREVYRDDLLRPRIDDATARVLAGEPPAADAPPRLADLARVRAALAPAGTPTDDDSTGRRVLAGIGAEVGAELIVPVEVRGGRPIASALRVEGARFAGVEILATVTGEGPAAVVEWAGAVTILRALLEPRAAAPRASASLAAPKPSVPPPGPRPADKPAERSVLRSPFFWGSLGAVAAVGIGIFVASRVSDDADDTFLVQGRVPR